jgi:putative ABC transport system permease protein
MSSLSLYKLLDSLRLGAQGVLRHKVRSILTVIGVVFGVLSVIASMAISAGGSHEAQKALASLGSTNIIIHSVKLQQAQRNASEQNYGMLTYGLTHQDVQALLANVPDIRCHALVHRSQKVAYHGGRSRMATLLSTDAAYARAAGVRVRAGRFISDLDQQQCAPHCVLTAGLARFLFGCESPLGQTILVAGDPFAVVGVIDDLRSDFVGGGADETQVAIIPTSALYSRFSDVSDIWGKGGGSWERVQVHQVILQMGDEAAVLDGAKVARALLGRTHAQEDFSVKVPLELIEQMKKHRRLWNIVFLCIASVSLVVGGVGIMNIMLASVTERTREIGVRRALGAKRRDIVTQFLVESVTLTTVGGLLGIGIGLLVPNVVEWVLKVTTIISATTLLLPLGMAVAVGLIAGLYPAYRAAQLDPIVALRHE